MRAKSWSPPRGDEAHGVSLNFAVCDVFGAIAIVLATTRCANLQNACALALIRSLSATLHLVPSRLIPHLGKLLGYFIYTFIPWRLHVLRTIFATPLLLFNHIHTDDVARRPPQLAPIARAGTASGCRLVGYGAARRFFSRLQCRRRARLLGAPRYLGARAVGVLAAHVPERSRRLGKVVYRPLHDTSLDRWLRRRRANTAGGEIALVPDAGSLGALRSALLAGGLVGLLPDQRPGNDSATVTAKRMLGIESCELSAGMAKLRQDRLCGVVLRRCSRWRRRRWQ